MSKRVTISNRWTKWEEVDIWGYVALVFMAIAFNSLIVHLWGSLSGMIRGTALIVMIVSAVSCDAILAWRKQWYWFWYWTICVLIGVSLWEIHSYFFGSKL